MNKHWPNYKSKWPGKRKRKPPGDSLGKEPIVFYREGGSIVRKFWDALGESTIGQITLAVMWGGATIYLLVTKQPVPTEVWAINTLILGFFFGSKVKQAMK